MAKIKTFSCIRPQKGLENRIAALPYDVYNRSEASIQVEKEPMSFLKIDRAETQFDESVDIHAPEVYEKAKQLLWDMVDNGAFVQEEQPGFYLYELTMAGRTQTGLVACASIDDYINDVVKKHENTRADKEADRICHVDICNAQTGPILMAYRKNEWLQELIAAVKKEQPLFSFVSEDGIRHQGWSILEAEKAETIEQIFRDINEIYIADGHHRAASAVAVGKKRRAEQPGYTGKEAFNYFLSVLFPDDELCIMDYNRIVKDIGDFTEAEFLEKVKEKFQVETQAAAYHPEKKGMIGMYLKDQWYSLEIKPEFINDDPVAGLDVSILQTELLEPVLCLRDIKTDPRIDFVGGIRGLEELERRVHTDAAVAFAMYPTSIKELFDVADANRLMPPKSTWFEPKLRSGLFIHPLNG